MRSGSRTTTINIPRPSASGGRSSSNFDQAIGIAKYAVLSAAIYGATTATLNLIKATITLADEYTSTQQRLKLYIKDAQTLGEVNTFLAKSAIQNNVGLRENAAIQRYYHQQMELLARETAAKKAAQEKAAQNAEKERQRQIAAAERQRQAELRGQSGSSTSRDVLGQIKGIAAYALLSTVIFEQ